jgi:hypothetical protein
MKTSWTLWTVGLAALATTPASGWAVAVTDHLACYKIKDALGRGRYTATVAGIVAQDGCTIMVPATTFCAPAGKTNVVPAPPGGGGIGTPNSFTCYKVKCPTRPKPVSPPTLSDQFGTRVVTMGQTELLCAPNAGATDGGFPATGQTMCWDDTGTVIPCAGTGQDGEIRAGARLAYVDNGDGTVTDVKTGLMWEKQSYGDGSVHDMNSIFHWDDLFTHVAALNGASFAGHTDWRPPNVRELASIANYENVNPSVSSPFNNNCVAPCTVATCSCTQGDNYWSSSTYAYVPKEAWLVGFYVGNVMAYDKVDYGYVRAVRDGS